MRKIYTINEDEQQLLDLASKFDYSKQISMRADIIKLISSFKYSTGGDTLFRGYFTPYLSWRKITNKKLGELINDDNKYSFKYGFNGSGDLIYCLYEDDVEELIQIDSLCSIGYQIELGHKELSRITLCRYENDRVSSVNSMCVFSNVIYEFIFEKYTYKSESILQSIEMINKLGLYAPRYHKLYLNSFDNYMLSKQWSDE